METERAQELLTNERKRIERDLRSFVPHDNDEPTTAMHMADQASDLYDAEFDEGRSDDAREQLAALERAEQRLADGTYGLSIESGESIPDARLEAQPLAERTTDEQARVDNGR